MDDILAKKNRHLFLEEKNNVGNSFIANVNNIVDDLDNIDAVANDLGRIDTVADNIDNVNIVAENIDDINTTVENLDKIDQFNDNLVGLLESLLEQLGEDGNAWLVRLTELGESILATTSAFNYAVTTTLMQDIASGATLTLPEAMKYRVGTHMLIVSWNGTVCYIGDQYDEIGDFGEWSTTITMNVPLKAGDKIQFRVVALADSTAFIGQIDSIIGNTSVVATGSTENRTLTNRFADIINVKDFGAVGDSITNDTSAIQAAISYASGKPIFFPAGTYLLNGSLTATKLTAFSFGNVKLLKGGNHVDAVIFVDECDGDVFIDNIDIDANNLANSGIKVAKSTAGHNFDVLIRNVHISNLLKIADFPSGDGVSVGGGFRHVWFDGCFVENVHMAVDAGVAGSQGICGFSIVRGYLSNSTDYMTSDLYCAETALATNCTVKNLWSLDSGYYMDQDGFKFFAAVNKTGDESNATCVIQNCKAINVRSRSVKLQAHKTIVSNFFVTKDTSCNNGDAGRNPLSLAEIESQTGGCLFHGINVDYNGYCMREPIRFTQESGYAGVINGGVTISDVKVTATNLSSAEDEAISQTILINTNGVVEGRNCYVNISNVHTSLNIPTDYFLWDYRVNNTYESNIYINIANVETQCSEKFIRNVNANAVYYISIVNCQVTNTTLYLLLNDAYEQSKINVVGCSGINVLRSISGCGTSLDGLIGIRATSGVAGLAMTDGESTRAAIQAHSYTGSEDERYSRIQINPDITNEATPVWIGNNFIRPGETEVFVLGDASYRWGSIRSVNGYFDNLYSETGEVSVSDARNKKNISSVNEALMRAWGKVNFRVFQFTDAIEKKGVEKARFHLGVIAQQVQEAFSSEGLDASCYGLFCYDEWEDEYDDEIIVDTEAVYDNDGTEVSPAQTHLERKLVREAGNRYGIRYEEALALECAYQRWLGEQRDAKIEALMQRISALENNQ